MNRYKYNLILLYLFNILFVVLSYYLDHIFHKSKQYTGFNFIFILNIVYFLWAYFSKLSIPIIHIFIIGTLYIGSEPAFENDHYRYIWEGKVLAHGHNPYRYSPSSKKLDHIQYSKREAISYNKLTSIYPPLAQLAFVSVSFFNYKTAFTLLQTLGLCLLIYIVMTLFKEDEYLVFILPYLYKEFVQAVHIDILAFFFIVLFFKRFQFFKGIFLAFQVKILSIVCLPFLILRGIFRERKDLLPTMIVTLLILLTFIVYPIKVGGYQSGASAYIQYWSWNSLIGMILNKMSIDPKPARLILLALFSLSYLFLIIRFIKLKFEKTWILSGIAFQFLLLFTPVLHPWYMFWPLIFMRVNKYYYYFLVSSVLAYYPYGNMEYQWTGEIVQFSLLSFSIYKSLIEMNQDSSGAKMSIWLPSGSNTEA